MTCLMGHFKSKLIKTVVLSRMRDSFLIQNVFAQNDENLKIHLFGIVFLLFFKETFSIFCS